MEPPARYSKDDIRDEKAKVFRSLRVMTPAEVPQNTVTGQYEEGAVSSKVVKGYDAEQGRFRPLDGEGPIPMATPRPRYSPQ